jgi:hypothetical protein
MNINKIVDKIYCINLKDRTEKRQFMANQFKKFNMKVSFFNAIRHKKGYIGCLLSHLEIIKMAKKNKYSKVLVLEDDCLFTKNVSLDPQKFPKYWNLLYLGGNVKKVLEPNLKNTTDFNDKQWVRMSCHTTHAYIINSNCYDKVIKDLEVYKKEVDVYYNDSDLISYILNPQIAMQREGWSDIEKKKINYVFQDVDDFINVPQAPHKYNPVTLDYKLLLKTVEDNELPGVSICTPTKDRKKFFPLAIYNFLNFNYPKHKLEWIIIDDGEENLKDVLPKDSRIKYVRLKTKRPLPVSYKRNLFLKYAKFDYFANMDDDDYYVPDSILTRMKVLLNNPQKKCIGCGIVCCYDIVNKGYYIVGNRSTFAEATMMYHRSFLEERNFNPKIRLGEGLMFIRNRKKYCVEIPYAFVIFVLNHRKNVTSDLRSVKDRNDYIDCYGLPEQVMKIIENL